MRLSTQTYAWSSLTRRLVIGAIIATAMAIALVIIATAMAIALVVIYRPATGLYAEHLPYLFLPVFGMARKRRVLPNVAASYARYSSDLQDAVTIESQQDECRRFALKESKSIAPELEFSDCAVSGTMLHRPGLEAMVAAASQGLFDTLYVFSLSRLARDVVITLSVLKRLVHRYGVRIVSTSEGVDSARDGWDTLAQLFSMQHERHSRELSAHVFRGQEKNAREGYSNGDYCFGYTSALAPGSENGRRGRLRPRMVYAIDSVAAEWVVRIFRWFVLERRSLRWIAGELNRLKAPKDHRATTPEWRHQYLAKLLANPKYVGIWNWGTLQNVRDPETGRIAQEERSDAEIQERVRQFPDLRIIDDETFAAAGERLRENQQRCAHRHRENGTFGENQCGNSIDYPRHLLSGLIVCGHCGSRFNVGGTDGKYMCCPGHAYGICPNKTTFRRSLAERLILEAVGQRVLNDPDWLNAILSLTQAAWRSQQATLPDEMAATQRAISVIDTKIQRLIDLMEQQEASDPAVHQRLAERRQERCTLQTRLDQLCRTELQLPGEPTEAWIRGKLAKLHEVLSAAPSAAAPALRALVGGAITVEEVPRPGKKRCFLRATFSISASSVSRHLILGATEEEGADGARDVITIDLVPSDPRDALAERVKELWDQEMPHQQIARELNLHKSQVTSLLAHWQAKHGITLPDGRTRRGERARSKLAPASVRNIADRVMALVEQGLLLQDIAATLQIDRNMVTAAIQYWYEVRGERAPDGRTRRKSLSRKVSLPQ